MRQTRDKANIVGEAIRVKRKSLLKNQEEFAWMIGIDDTQLGELERGKAFPSFPTLVNLRKVTGISIDKIIDQINEEIENKTDTN